MIETTWSSLNKAFRPSTTSPQKLHFRKFFIFLKYFNLPLAFQLQSVLFFLQFLANNGLQPKVIANYVSSMATWYNLEHTALSHHSIFLLLRSFRINNPSPPTFKGIFDISTLKKIIHYCKFTSDPDLFKAIFLTAFFGFLRISNIAPHSKALFNPTMHFLRQDIIFHPPGCHLKIKWSKTNQSKRNVQWLQLPKLSTNSLCLVNAIYQLIKSRPLPPNAPLFAHKSGDPVINTTIRDTLKNILLQIGISPQGHSFHTFRRSGATWAFDHEVPLEHIMIHGNWEK